MTYSVTGLPEGATLNAAAGEFCWTPGVGQVGDYLMLVTISDGLATTTDSFVLRAVTELQQPHETKGSDLELCTMTAPDWLPWLDRCGQVLLESEWFVERLAPGFRDKRLVTEIPRRQRFAARPTLRLFFGARTS